jgi:DNA-binding MarR family transcriptional regulator
VTATLNRMEKNGLIVRESVPEDARLKRIVLTEKAISLHNDVEKECQFFESVLTAGISMEDLEQFQKTLQVMCKNLTDYESKGGNSTC